MQQQLEWLGICRNKRHQQRQLFKWLRRKAHSPWPTMVKISSLHSESGVMPEKRMQGLGIFFYSLKFLCEIFYPHQIQWPNFSQPAWGNKFHLFFQCSLLVLPFKLTAEKQKTPSGLLAEAWPKYSFEHRAMNPHVKNPSESSPCDTWLGQRQPKRTGSILISLGKVPPTDASYHHCWKPGHGIYAIAVINKVENSPARLPLFRSDAVKMTLLDSASRRRIKKRVPGQGMQSSSARVWFPAQPSLEWRLSASQLRVKKPTIPQI